jgi:hypothetical protein
VGLAIHCYFTLPVQNAESRCGNGARRWCRSCAMDMAVLIGSKTQLLQMLPRLCLHSAIMG